MRLIAFVAEARVGRAILDYLGLASTGRGRLEEPGAPQHLEVLRGIREAHVGHAGERLDTVRGPCESSSTSSMRSGLASAFDTARTARRSRS